MNPSNFYVVCATVIPVLALTRVVRGGQLQFDELSDDAAEIRVVVLDWGLRIARLITAAQWLVTGWAEFICLRHLETGRVPTGGPVVVWIALTVTGAQIVFAEVTPSATWAINTGFRHFYHGLRGVGPEVGPPSDEDQSA
jgi:hypothetical protein